MIAKFLALFKSLQLYDDFSVHYIVSVKNILLIECVFACILK